MITTHVLDIGRGGAAVDVDVVLEVRRAGEWIRIGTGRTDVRGRIVSLNDAAGAEAGRHRLTFDTGAYHKRHGVAAFFPEVQVVFDVTDALQDVHVPLVISPFGYSTYRGT
ncbi:MAG: hydroxyisourate hydrolase [Luteitalea sp.]|nr:hydroxyisourate hydrolase [Luteitalea sp.]